MIEWLKWTELNSSVKLITNEDLWYSTRNYYFEITYKGNESVKEYIYIYAVLCISTQLCLIPCNPMDCSPPGSSAHGDSPGKYTGVGFHNPFSGKPPNPGIKPRSSALWADSLSSEPPGKPKNTGVGSLSLLQGIFLTQESNQGLLHHRGFFTSWATRDAHTHIYV